MQIVLPPEVEALVQRQLTSGKYNSAIDVILAAIQTSRTTARHLSRTTARTPTRRTDWWQASQRGEVVDGATAMAQIRANMRSRYSSKET
jgi:antitoxin ParD1/3/4